MGWLKRITQTVVDKIIIKSLIISKLIQYPIFNYFQKKVVMIVRD